MNTEMVERLQKIYDDEENAKKIIRIIKFIDKEKIAGQKIMDMPIKGNSMNQFIKARTEGMMSAYDHIKNIIDELE